MKPIWWGVSKPVPSASGCRHAHASVSHLREPAPAWLTKESAIPQGPQRTQLSMAIKQMVLVNLTIIRPQTCDKEGALDLAALVGQAGIGTAAPAEGSIQRPQHLGEAGRPAWCWIQACLLRMQLLEPRLHRRCSSQLCCQRSSSRAGCEGRIPSGTLNAWPGWFLGGHLVQTLLVPLTRYRSNMLGQVGS